MSKVRLHIDDFELSGYTNIKISNLDDTLLIEYDNGELDELVIQDVLDYLPIDKVEDTLLRLSRLLKKGGKLIVSGTDLYEVCKAMSNYNIDVAQANKVIFGENPNRTKTLSFTTVSMANFLEVVAKLKILKKRINFFSYVVEAVR